jgi:hypothetical protein
MARIVAAFTTAGPATPLGALLDLLLEAGGEAAPGATASQQMLAASQPSHTQPPAASTRGESGAPTPAAAHDQHPTCQGREHQSCEQ